MAGAAAVTEISCLESASARVRSMRAVAEASSEKGAESVSLNPLAFAETL
jgi:hypothetical protein